MHIWYVIGFRAPADAACQIVRGFRLALELHDIRNSWLQSEKTLTLHKHLTKLLLHKWLKFF